MFDIGILESFFGKKTVEVYCGKVSDGLLLKAKENDLVINDIEEEMTRKVEDFIASVEKEYKEKIEQALKEFDSIWDEIYTELGLDPNKKYTLKKSTGKVFEKVPLEPESGGSKTAN